MASDERRDLDQQLDDALRSYAAEAPASGLEGRVLARVRRGSSAWLWAGAVAVAAAAAFVMIFFQRPFYVLVPSAPVREATVRPVTPVPLRPAQRPITRAKIEQAKGQKVKIEAPKARAPKLPMFPSAPPLTAEEQALVQLALQAAKAEEAAPAPPPKPLEPIRIAGISIEPLQVR